MGDTSRKCTDSLRRARRDGEDFPGLFQRLKTFGIRVKEPCFLALDVAARHCSHVRGLMFSHLLFSKGPHVHLIRPATVRGGRN